jgi:putative DNA-invertase from lambdoid prophage Rac
MQIKTMSSEKRLVNPNTRGFENPKLAMRKLGITTKEGYELGNNISSKVLAFAFSLSAEIERSMISSRTKEALARKKREGKRLGRPKGRLSSVTKLSGKDDLIREYLEKKIPQSVIARLLNVHRLTVRNDMLTRKLQKPSP